MTVIRQTSIGNRRRSVRLPVELPAKVISSQGIVETATVDLSTGGVLIQEARGLPQAGSTAELKIGDLPAVKARIVACSTVGVHCAFHDPAEAFGTAVRSLFADLERQARPLILRSQDAAARIAVLFEKALATGEISERQLFDTAYEPVPASNPQQFTTELLPRLESWLTPLQETLRASDSNIVFCCAVDRNGYLPVHNAEYSKPQRPDDPVWNAAHSRNRRIFDDRAGLTCARSTQPYYVHAYRRDMGGGHIQVLKEFVAPITVRGRHWGGFRCAYRI